MCERGLGCSGIQPDVLVVDAAEDQKYWYVTELLESLFQKELQQKPPVKRQLTDQATKTPSKKAKR